MKRIIWTSSMDLSPEGVASFCKQAADRYGKSEEELRALSLMDLSTCYMWNERRRLLREATKQLSVSSKLPILVIADKADFMNQNHHECFVLSGEHISEIFSCREGLSTTFFSDGKDIRCEDITEEGTNFYLFRLITTLKGLGAFTSQVEQGEPFTESQLSALTESLAPQVHQLLGWDVGHESLNLKISQADGKKPYIQTSGKEPVMSLER